MKCQPYYFTAVVFCAFLSCNAGNNTNKIDHISANDTISNVLMNNSIEVPAGYQELLEVTGNLDSTEADEKVIVYNTERMVEMGRLREIRIYKSKNMKWSLWHSSVGAILPSEHGGALGDPFQEIEIKNGSIVISHLGGGREKWSYRHQYRFQQNDWKLIGARVFFGMPCDTMQNFDYDLITGNIQYEKLKENCNKPSNTADSVLVSHSFVRKWKTLPSMDSFYPGDNEILIPESDLVFYY